MIDASWDFETGTGSGIGNTGSSNYTTVAWVEGVGKGTTITPAKGDTGKTMLFLNAGDRHEDGNRYHYGTIGLLLSTNQRDATSVWRIAFASSYTAGNILADPKLHAKPLRCVRS